ncbi:MAG: hypothetical protein M3Y08_05240 [Fibrobacterota bacterium]|nr:hypothetical protein [Fibrobacterota bacterium]
MILVGYSTGISVAGGVIYHDQKLLKEGKPVLSWCHDNAPTPGNMENARHLLSSHIAWVVGHNPVVAGSHYAAKEPFFDGKFYTLTGMPLMAASFTYLFYEDVNTVLGAPFRGALNGFISQFGAVEFAAWFKPVVATAKALVSGANCLLGGNAICNALGTTGIEIYGNWKLLQTFEENSAGNLAVDLGWTQDYFTELRSYQKPPLDILTINDPKPRLIEYKTVASKNFLYPKAIDDAITVYFMFNILRHWPIIGPEQRLDRLFVTMAGMGGMMLWRKVAETDIVLEPDEDVTSAKALHKSAKIQHKVVDNIAHAKISDVTNPPSYPYHPDIWQAMRPYMFDHPVIVGSRISKHKCINHAGDPNVGCQELRPGYSVLPSIPINKNEFYQDLRLWKNPEGESLQPPTVEFDPKNKEQVIVATDAGGSPLAYEAFYKSNLMASDKVEGYVNGKWTPLRFRKDYGNETDPLTHSGLVRVPLTKVRFHKEDGSEQNPFWRDFESILQDGGNIVGFRGTNPAGTVLEKRVIRYDKKGVIVSTNLSVKGSNGTVIATPKTLNLGVFSNHPGNPDPARLEVGPKGILFAFKTDQIPQFGAGNLDKVKVDVFGTRDDGQMDRTRKATYTLAPTAYPGNSPKYNPYDATAEGGRVYLSPRPADPTEGASPHQLFFWIKPSDLLLNNHGRDQAGNPVPSPEGVKHAVLLVTKPQTGGEAGNQTFYQLEFAVDNTAPSNLRVFSPTLVASPAPGTGNPIHSYEDQNGDGQWTDDVVACSESASGLCNPGVDGVDNDGNGQIDELGELRLIKTYSQGRNERGERINQGIHIRFSLNDNLQDAYPFTEGMKWRILDPAGATVVESAAQTYAWGSTFSDFHAFLDGVTWVDGLYALEVEVPDLAGNTLKTIATRFIIDNTPPQVALAVAGGSVWSGNQSGLAGRQKSLLQRDAYSSTMVTSSEEARIRIRLTPMAGTGTFIINSSVPASIPTAVDDAGIPLIIYDDFQYLAMSGLATSNGEKFYQKLPDGKYKVEVFATDKVGNMTPAAIAGLSTSGFDFIVDRTPPSITLVSVLPFLVPQGEEAILNIQVNQSLDNVNTVTSKLEYTLAFDNGPVFRTTEANFQGPNFSASILLPSASLASLSEGPHRIVFEVAEKDESGLRNRARLSAVFVHKSWGVVLTRPTDNGSVTGVVPVAGRVGDPDIQDAIRFSSFRLTYVAGHYDNPASLPASRLTAGLRAVGSTNEVGAFETSVPDNLGVWDTRVATGGQGPFTLILEAMQTDGKKKTALCKVTIDNSGVPPAAASRLEFTAFEAPEAKFKLSGNPAQIMLSVFRGATLINRKSAISGPLDFDQDFFPQANKAVVGVDEGQLRIRFRPGEADITTAGSRYFAFLIKGFRGDAADVQTRFYDGAGALLEGVSASNFVVIADGALQHSPSDAPMPVGEGARIAEVLVPVSLLDGSVNIHFGNRLYDLLNPSKSADPYLPPASVLIGASHVPTLTNPFSYNLKPAIEWKETNFLGEEVEAGDYTLQIEGYSLDGTEYIPAIPAQRTYQKAAAPRLRIANARVGAAPLVPILAGDILTAKASLAFSVSRSAYVTVNLYKVGDVAPTMQIASKVLVAGGYSRIVDFLGTELRSGQATLEPGSWYYFRIVAVAKDNAADVCAVSASEAACYDKDAGSPLKLDFKIGQAPTATHFWDGRTDLPFVLTSRTDSPDPSNLQEPTIVTPVSDVSWKVEEVQGRYYPPIRIQYKVKKKGVAPTIYLGYDLKVDDYVENGKSKSEWNYMHELINGDTWIQGSYKSRYLFLAVRKDWGNGKTLRFTGPSLWAKGGAQTGLTMDQVWNGGTSFGRGPAEDGIWWSDCELNTEGRCHEVEANPALDFNPDGRFHFRGDIDLDNRNITYWPEYFRPWETWWDGDEEEDGFLQLGHWNRVYEGVTYSEFGFKGSYTDWVKYAAWVRLNMNITRAGSQLSHAYLDEGEQGRNQLLPGQGMEFDLVGSSGSLRHMKFKAPEAVGFSYSDPGNTHTYRYERELETNSQYWAADPWSHHGWYSLGTEKYALIADSRDFFKVSGKFIVHGLGGAPVEVAIPPELVDIKLVNRQAHLGDKNVQPNEYIPLFKKSLPLTGTSLGTCGGTLDYQLLWADETKRYRMKAEWVPNPDPGCAVQAAEKVAVSGPRFATLRVSPFTVAPASNIQGGGNAFAPYTTYLNTADPRFNEFPIDHDQLVDQLAASQLGGLIPVDWDGTKAYDVELVGATLPDGTPVPLDRIQTGFSAAPDHFLALRASDAETLSENLATKPWGGFKSTTFAGPVLFDSWVPATLTASFCHEFNSQGGCNNPAVTTPESHPHKLYHRNLATWTFNNDVKLTRLRTVLRNVVGGEHPHVSLLHDNHWQKSADAPGYLLTRENLFLDPVPLRLTLNKGVTTPQRFVSERISNPSAVDRTKTIETHLEADSRLLPIRTVLPDGDFPRLAFEVGHAQGRVLHVSKTFGSPAKEPSSLERMDLRTFLIGQKLDLNSADPGDRKLVSAYGRVGIQYQQPDPYHFMYGSFAADVVSVDLRALAFKYPSANIPHLDQLVAPAFSLYPDLLDFRDFQG